jgi:hypothetical protein
MLLYHFTKPENVEGIKRDGLLPNDDRQNMVGPLQRIVWLTQTPTLVMTDTEAELVFERLGVRFPDNRWMGRGIPMVQFTLRIPLADRKLKQYKRWLRNHHWEGRPDLNDPLFKRACDTWWLYFGTIEPALIVGCSTVTG